MNILIVTGGSLDREWAGRELDLDQYDRVIAADSGLAHCRGLHIAPDDITGDFDSLSDKDLLSFWKEKGRSVTEYPARKDYTDTDLALRLALTYQPDRVDVIAASGTRLDHTMANVGLLVPMEEAGVSCRILDAHNQIEVIKGPSKRTFFKDASWPYLSVLSLTREVTGLTMEGFSYPVKNVSLPAFQSRGISNELAAQEGSISLDGGLLLVIRARD